MVLAWEIKAEIVAWVDQASFSRAWKKIEQFARDTWRKLDPVKRQKLEMNVANATLKLQSLRKQLKLVWNDVAKKKELIIETNRAQSNLTEVKRRLQNFRNVWDETTSRLQQKFNSIWKSIFSSLINPITLAIWAVVGIWRAFKGAVDAFRWFEKIQKQVQSIAWASGATRQELESLTEEAKRLGAATKFTAAEVSTLQLELSKLGFDPEQINSLTESTLNLSAAFNQDLWETAKTVGATLKIFWLDAEEATRVNDVMAASFANSSLDLEKFSNAITTAGPVAKTFGFSLEETTSLLGELANAGFDASSAGTATRNILLNMADANWKLAVALWKPVNNLWDLTDGLRTLRDRNIDLAETLELTDKRSVAAFNRFIAGADSVDVLNQKLLDSGGVAEKLAEEQLNSLDGSLTLMWSAVDGVAIKLGNFFAPAIRLAADGISWLLWTSDEATPAMDNLKNKIRELAEEMREGNISIEEFKERLWELTAQSTEQIVAEAKLAWEKAKFNAEITLAQEEIEKYTKSLEVNAIALAEGALSEEKFGNQVTVAEREIAKQIEILEKAQTGLEWLTQKADEFAKQEEKNIVAQQVFTSTFWDLDGALAWISTAKTQQEFDNMIQATKASIKAKLEHINTIIAEQRVLRSTWAISWAQYKQFAQQALSSVKVIKTAWDSVKSAQFEAVAAPPEAPKWPGGKSVATSQAEKDAKEQKKIREKAAKAEEERQKKVFDTIKTKWVEAYKAVWDSIEDSTKLVDKFTDQIEKGKIKIEGIREDADKALAESDKELWSSLAARAVEIEKELKEAREWWAVDTNRVAELQEELRLAKQYSTEEERINAKRISQESETEKLLREQQEEAWEIVKQADEEIAAEQAIIDEKRNAIETEKQLQLELEAEKERIERSFTEFLAKEFKLRKDLQDKILSEWELKEGDPLFASLTKPTSTPTVTTWWAVSWAVSEWVQAWTEESQEESELGKLPEEFREIINRIEATNTYLEFISWINNDIRSRLSWRSGNWAVNVIVKWGSNDNSSTRNNININTSGQVDLNRALDNVINSP